MELDILSLGCLSLGAASLQNLVLQVLHGDALQDKLSSLLMTAEQTLTGQPQSLRDGPTFLTASDSQAAWNSGKEILREPLALTCKPLG